MEKEQMYRQIEDHYRKYRNASVASYSRAPGGRAGSEDIVQEAYCRALKYWKTFDAEQPFDFWMLTILTNSARDHFKTERLNGICHEPPVDMRYDVPFNSIYLKEILKIVEKKEDNIRRILKLRFLDNYPTLEIAQIVPESHSSVRKIIQRFRQELKERAGE